MKRRDKEREKWGGRLKPVPFTRSSQGVAFSLLCEALRRLAKLRVHAFACLVSLASLPLIAGTLDPVTKAGVTLRVVESGVFQRSLAQGLELELINQADSPIACEVRMILQRSAADAGEPREV